MKVIDILNKIANREEVPEKIKVNDEYYCYDETDDNEVARYRTSTYFLLIDNCHLTDEVEVIEEDNKIEKWNEFAIQEMLNDKDIENIKRYIQTIMETQNEIIDYIYKEKQNEIIDYIYKEKQND